MTKFDLKEVATMLRNRMIGVCDDEITSTEADTLYLSDMFVELEYNGWSFGIVFDADVTCVEDYDVDEYGRRHYYTALLENADFYNCKLTISNENDEEITVQTLIDELIKYIHE